MTRTNKGLVHLIGLAVLLFGLFGQIRSSEARLDPFFVLRAQSFAKFQPRILFVIDTSGSMTWKPSLPDQGCYWAECEQPGAGHSRIYAARKAVREVIQQTSEQASFGLMSFGHVKAPLSTQQIPTKCFHQAFNQENRFTWVTTNSAPLSGYVWSNFGWQWQYVWSSIINVFGTQGTWMLCGDNRPFPYLRHDNLGFNMPQKSNEVLLEQPLYKTKSNLNTFLNGANYNRKVQWFTRYLGRRFNLDCSKPLEDAIVQASRGDWGTTVNTKKTNICGKDFYYWPYVDGFPGYSYLWARGTYSSTETECYDDASCYTGNDNWYQPGVARRDTFAASLWSPFYSEAVLADPSIASDQKGPLTAADAALTMDGLVSDMYAGGIDASGGTPWRSAVGNVDFYVSIDANQQIVPKNTFVKTNAAFQQYSVASYLTFIQSMGTTDLCRPTAVVYITDGQPDPWDTEGGSELYTRLSKIRRLLGVKSYIVGFSQGFENNQTAWDRLQGMACAAGGSTNYFGHPCDFDNQAYGWDTCRDRDNPHQGCAWLADDSETLSKALVQIIAGVLQNEVPGGPGMTTSEFIPNQNPNASPDAVQTFLASYTDTAGLKGHVTRSGCDTEDPENPGQLASWCENASLLPLDTEEEESFGPCPLGRVWDAGECLALTDWTDRRIYTHDANKQVFRIADATGDATAQFEALVKTLNSQGKISPALSNNVQTQNAEIQALAEFLLGKNMPDDWKLAGVPNSSPILVRRIPKPNESFLPTVGIRDPHCAGRRAGAGEADIPASLKTFAANSWNLGSGGGLGQHYEYTEAVLIGDDLGLMHAFHYDSGNELFALLPMDLISHARQLSVNGTANFGQSNDIDEHVYGVAATANVGWAYDHQNQTWRHLASWGFGAGGNELLVFDVSHMGRLAQDDPIDLLWTTETVSIADDYDDSLGETWSRPALTYMIPGDSIANEPYAYLVFGSGYRHNQGPVHRGRTVWLVDALTGETYHDTAFFQAPPDQRYYDTPDDFAAINDPAIGTHCLSRFWAEMQEAYIADPAGRLFRWDIAPDTNNPYVFPQTSNSGGKWAAGGNGLNIGKELFRFPACQSKSEFDCTVDQIKQNGNQGDLFVFSPAVAANNKIDPPNDDGGVLTMGERDQFLIAMISGSPNDNVTDGGDPNNDFHSSLYLIADDHRAPNSETGVSIPGFGGLTPPGSNAKFMRLALTDVERTRTIEFPDGSTEIETRAFTKAAKPLRSPLVKVTGAAQGADILDVEVFYVVFTVYEPGEQTCDPRWYDDDNKQWTYDYGDTYEITFRLVVEDGQPFNFLNGYSLPADGGDGFGTSGNLSAPVVRQIDGDGMIQKAPGTSPCDPNKGGSGLPTGPTAVSLGWSQLQGFSPLEVDL
ncbi:type IV pilin biogenesis protein [Nannocystaceae bacterium ST9]